MKPVESWGRNPIYIYSPVSFDSLDILDDLRELCLRLIDAGFQAWLAPPLLFFGSEDFESRNVHAPVLNNETLRMHFEAAIPPVVIYPDTVRGNPLNAQLVSRWLISNNNFDQDQCKYQKSEFHFSLARSTNERDVVSLSGLTVISSPEVLGYSLIDFAGSADYLSPVRSRRKLPLGRIGLAWHVLRTEGFVQLGLAVAKFLITKAKGQK